MPHMSMTTDEQVDYSSYEYQTVTLEVGVAGDANANPRVSANINHEVLEGIGGLANNEVAELVAMETTASIEYEAEQGDQSFDTQEEVRGVVGANLPASESVLPGSGSDVDGDIYDDQSGGAALARGSNKSEDRVFQLFETRGGAAFLDTAAGAGGGVGLDRFHNTKSFRELTGRGPVLDSSDDISINAVFNAGDLAVDAFGIIRVHLIWDVAETDDAGRAFSVPS